MAGASYFCSHQDGGVLFFPCIKCVGIVSASLFPGSRKSAQNNLKFVFPFEKKKMLSLGAVKLILTFGNIISYC